MVRCWLVVIASALGCSGPLVPSGAESSSGEAEPPAVTTMDTPSPTSTSTTGPPTTITTTGPADTSAGEPVGTTGASTDDTGDSTGVSGFIIVPDGGGCGDGGFCPASEGVLASCIYCSYLDQDCGPGEVCKPRDNCDAGTWSRSACVRAQPQANGQPGDPCTMEEGPYSGLDTCGPQSMCFDVDPVTLEGACVEFCEAGSPNFDCEDADQTCFRGNDGWAPVCLPRCSPLLGDCPAGQGCYPGTEDDFVCITQGLPLYNDLATLHPSCQPGSFMTTEEVAGACPEDGPCCATFCDLAAQNCDDGLSCLPYYDDLQGIDAAYHDVGFCAPEGG